MGGAGEGCFFIPLPVKEDFHPDDGEFQALNSPPCNPELVAGYTYTDFFCLQTSRLPAVITDWGGAWEFPGSPEVVSPLLLTLLHSFWLYL